MQSKRAETVVDLDNAAWGAPGDRRGHAPAARPFDVTLEQVTQALREAQFALRDQACGIGMIARAAGAVPDEQRMSALRAHAEVLQQLAEQLAADSHWGPSTPAA